MATRISEAVEKSGTAPGQVGMVPQAPDADPRISTPHVPIKGAAKYRTGRDKVVTPTPTRTAEWYERHGFKKA